MDGRPAEDSTQVLVWYSATAIHFAIRAFEAHGAAHATLADRDKIAADDYVQIMLDTFNDRRRAQVFGVNPFGVQSDGTLSEGSQSKVSGSGGISAALRDTVDLSPIHLPVQGQDHDQGYEIEIEIPFKSLRYQSIEPADLGLQRGPKVQHSGYEDTWTPARRSGSSFLGRPAG